MGHSHRTFSSRVDLSPEVTVLAIDPWPQIVGPNLFYDTHPVGRLHARQLREPDGLYHAFPAALWGGRDRVIPRGGTGPSE